MIIKDGQKCEICGQSSNPIFDGAAVSGPYGPKGHFMFMCPACHLIKGLNYDEEMLTIYKKILGRYFELKGMYILKTQDIQRVVLQLRSESPQEDEWKIVLLGEIAVQLSLQTSGILENNELLRQFLITTKFSNDTEDSDG